jgi:hypothetical protein
MKASRFDPITIEVNDLDAAMEIVTRCFDSKSKDRRRVKHLGAECGSLNLGTRTAIKSPGSILRICTGS